MSALNQIYHVKINSLQGKPINLLDYKGKKILFVNVASKCGFTPQYRDLQKLYDQYQDQLMIIGVPVISLGNKSPEPQAKSKNFVKSIMVLTFLSQKKSMLKETTNIHCIVG